MSDKNRFCQQPLSEENFNTLVSLLAQRSLFPLRDYFHYCHLPAQADFSWHSESDEQFGVGILLSGKLASMREEESVKTIYSDEIFRSGMLVGDDGFLYKYRQGCSVTALENSELLLISKESYARLEQDHPELSGLIMKWLLNLLTDRLIWSQADKQDKEEKEKENV